MPAAACFRLSLYCVSLSLLCVAASAKVHAQTLSTLYRFDGADGAYPSGALVQAGDGNFYGTTLLGGANDDGTVFVITPAGLLTTLHSFDGADGAHPGGALVQARDGNFYGTTIGGGANGYGTVFEITPGGLLTTLHSFASADGSGPRAGLVQGIDGNFYGTTSVGGAYGNGSVFKITPNGVLTTLHSFLNDGILPFAALVQASDGNFYGTTVYGGANDKGTVFQITPGGVLTTLHSFDGADGQLPYAGLIQANNGSFYGTTIGGGANGDGTVFAFTRGGILSTLYNFCSEPNCTDGYEPLAGLVQASNGNLYGTTQAGGENGSVGANGDGTVFSFAPQFYIPVLPPSGSTFYVPSIPPLPQLYAGLKNNYFLQTRAATYAVVPEAYDSCSNLGANSSYCSSQELFTDEAASATAAARANFGSVGVSGVGGESSNFDTYFYDVFAAYANPTAFSADTITISSTLPISGFLAFSVTLSGDSSIAINGDEGTGYTAAYVSFNYSPFYVQLGNSGVNDTFLLRFNTGVDYDPTTGLYFDNVPMTIDMTATGLCGSSFAGLCDFSSYYYDTLQITGVNPVDANGKPLQGVSLKSASGYSYNASPSAPSGTSCNGFYYGTFTGNITVSSGQQCEISGGRVTGNITVTGGTLIVKNASVGGDVKIQNGGNFVLGPAVKIKGDLKIQYLPSIAAEDTVCGTSVGGDLDINNNGTSAIEIGSTNASGCAGNLIGDDLQISNNKGQIQVFNNSVSGDLNCVKNTSITGGGNTATQKQNQCSTF